MSDMDDVPKYACLVANIEESAERPLTMSELLRITADMIDNNSRLLGGDTIGFRPFSVCDVVVNVQVGTVTVWIDVNKEARVYG